MKKTYEKPKFIPIELEANVLAECQFTNNWGWGICPIVVPGLPDVNGDGIGTVFSDTQNVCDFTNGADVSICDHAPDHNSNTFGS